MRLYYEWVRHSPDIGFLGRGVAKCVGSMAATIKADALCECGHTDLHEHCPGCGLTVSTGSGEIIAEYTLSPKATR